MPSRKPTMTGARHRQRGSIASFMVLAIGGALLATAYALDTHRMTSSAAQVKRATDAAAMAVGNERLMKNEKSPTVLHQLAYGYVVNNLGMDSSLARQIGPQNVELEEQTDNDQRVRYKVEVNFEANPELLGGQVKQMRVHSTVEVVARATEVAIVIPNSGTENNTELAALRQLFKRFAARLLDDDENSEKRIWLSLVPYSQVVNVYDREDTGRLRRWATGAAIRPVELTSLWRTGIRDLGDGRMPDPRTQRVCMNRGLYPGQVYFWDQPPAGQFTRVYYRHDLPENHPLEPSISWTGPNPDFGQATGVNDTRFIIGNVGCPRAALLPLTNQLSKVEERLDEMRTGFNVNYAIAMGWAGHALSPEMRGSAGWGDSELPLDFPDSDNAQNAKIIVMLANTIGDWFDTDAFNAGQVGEAVQSGTNDPGGTVTASKRFQDLCESFRGRHLKFHFIGVRPGDPQDFGRQLFDRVAGVPLQTCTQGGGSMTFADAPTFNQGQEQIQNLLDDIADKIKHEFYARLVE
jgi:hypothetical protein